MINWYFRHDETFLDSFDLLCRLRLMLDSYDKLNVILGSAQQVYNVRLVFNQSELSILFIAIKTSLLREKSTR